MSEQSEGASARSAEQGLITIKKYANRRLYNTATSCYVTLDYLARLVKTGAQFAVYDAKTGEDITRSVLTHIIVEKEAEGQSMLPVSFLRHLISFYGDSLQVIIPRYLEHTMQLFAHNQEQFRSYLGNTFDGLVPFGQIEEMSKHQLAIFEHAMRLFTPFQLQEQEDVQDARGGGETSSVAEEQINELRTRVNDMQKQLDALTAQRRAR
ncbi:MAG: polyhydroxyalkanoate synthesis repressor PhaR [Rhodospirillales bacterium]